MGRNGRGVDTFERRRHFLGVNRNYNIYIIPIYALKMASPFQGFDAPTVQISSREGKGMGGRGGKGKGMEGWGRDGEWKGRGWEGNVGALIPSKGGAIS